jgi:hypothetical protein
MEVAPTDLASLQVQRRISRRVVVAFDVHWKCGCFLDHFLAATMIEEVAELMTTRAATPRATIARGVAVEEARVTKASTEVEVVMTTRVVAPRATTTRRIVVEASTKAEVAMVQFFTLQ